MNGCLTGTESEDGGGLGKKGGGVGHGVDAVWSAAMKSDMRRWGATALPEVSRLAK